MSATVFIDSGIQFKYPIAGIVLLFCLAFFGCDSSSDYQVLDLTNKVAIEKPHAESAPGTKAVRVAVAAMISPQATFAYYQEMIDYMGKKIGTGVHLVQRKTYAEVNEMLAKGEIDLAFICSGPYATVSQVYGFQALATPVVKGSPFYQSYLIVHRDSDIQNFGDLRGKVFAFTDPDSNSGSLVPNFWLSGIGETARSFFRETTYTYSHDNSIMAVARGLVDGAAVDGHKWEFYNLRSPQFTAMTRIVQRSEPFGSPPLVASLNLDEASRARIQSIFLAMHEDAEGVRILEKIMVDRFERPEEEWYDPIRSMYAHVHQKPS